MKEIQVSSAENVKPSAYDKTNINRISERIRAEAAKLSRDRIPTGRLN